MRLQRIRLGFRSKTIAAFFLLLVAGLPLMSRAKEADEKLAGQATPITHGLRVFSCGHSFHYWIPGILSGMARSAGIEGHEAVGLSAIGGSRVIQHWNVPDEKNQAKAALRAGKVDVLTLSPMHQPDEGIEKFAELGLKGNPNIRVTIQEFWIPYDSMQWPYQGEKGAKSSVKHFDTATITMLRKLHAPYFKTFDDYVVKLNARLGKQVVFVVPVGQAVIALREKVIVGQAPGIEKQSDLFSDPLGHPKAAIQALAGYCQFAVMYRRNPVGMPMPTVLTAAKQTEDLNRLLQSLAWEAVSHHPLSGLAAAK
jgi:hypothetical protein